MTSVPPEVLDNLTCPPDPPLPLPDGTGRVAEGSVAAMMCKSGPWGKNSPDEILMNGLDELETVVNSADSQECDYGETDYTAYSLVFAYPDATTETVYGMLAGCGTLVVDRVERNGARQTRETFLALLGEQSEQSG